MFNWSNHARLPTTSNNHSHTSLLLSFMNTCSALNSLGCTLDLYLSNLPERPFSLFLRTFSTYTYLNLKRSSPVQTPELCTKSALIIFDGLNWPSASTVIIYYLAQALNIFYNILADFLCCYVSFCPSCLPSNPNCFITDTQKRRVHGRQERK